MRRKEAMTMIDAKVLVLLLTVLATGGWYCYVVFGVLTIVILKNIKKKREVKTW
jgi:hypothetical protein